MKVTNGEIRMMQEALSKLNSLRIPVRLSFKIAKLANKVGDAFRAAEVVRVKLVNEHGVKDKTGNFQVTLAPIEEQEKFWAEFVELLNEEVELDVDPIELPADLEVEPAILMPLVRFIKV